MTEFTNVDIQAEDRIGRVKVSCETLRALLAEARLREQHHRFGGGNLMAGIAQWVSVPVCDCGLCQSHLAECRKEKRRIIDRSIITPVLSCKTACRLWEQALKQDSPIEEDRLKDIVDASVVIHQCKDRSECLMQHKSTPTVDHEMARLAQDQYREFLRNRPWTSMRITTKSGSVYELYHRREIVGTQARVIRNSSEGEVVEQPLTTFVRLGDRLLINDWSTTPVASTQLQTDEEARDEAALPPWGEPVTLGKWELPDLLKEDVA